MSKTNIAVIIYILGLAVAAIFLDLWGAETNLKALLGLAWTAIFLVSLFYIDEKS